MKMGVRIYLVIDVDGDRFPLGFYSEWGMLWSLVTSLIDFNTLYVSAKGNEFQQVGAQFEISERGELSFVVQYERFKD